MSRTNHEFLTKLLKQTSDGVNVKDGYVIAYFSDQVCIGLWKNGNPVLPAPGPDWEKLQQLHLFNEEEELRLIRNHRGDWLRRYLKDDAEGKDVQDRYDEDLLIIGNGPDKVGAFNINDADFITCSEAGRSVTLPREAIGKRIRVRNYLKDVDFEERVDILPIEESAQGVHQPVHYPPLSALQVTDYRFMGFYDFKGGAS